MAPSARSMTGRTSAAERRRQRRSALYPATAAHTSSRNGDNDDAREIHGQVGGVSASARTLIMAGGGGCRGGSGGVWHSPSSSPQSNRKTWGLKRLFQHKGVGGNKPYYDGLFDDDAAFPMGDPDGWGGEQTAIFVAPQDSIASPQPQQQTRRHTHVDLDQHFKRDDGNDGDEAHEQQQQQWHPQQHYHHQQQQQQQHTPLKRSSTGANARPSAPPGTTNVTKRRLRKREIEEQFFTNRGKSSSPPTTMAGGKRNGGTEVDAYANVEGSAAEAYRKSIGSSAGMSDQRSQQSKSWGSRRSLSLSPPALLTQADLTHQQRQPSNEEASAEPQPQNFTMMGAPPQTNSMSGKSSSKKEARSRRRSKKGMSSAAAMLLMEQQDDDKNNINAEQNRGSQRRRDTRRERATATAKHVQQHKTQYPQQAATEQTSTMPLSTSRRLFVSDNINTNKVGSSHRDDENDDNVTASTVTNGAPLERNDVEYVDDTTTTEDDDDRPHPSQLEPLFPPTAVSVDLDFDDNYNEIIQQEFLSTTTSPAKRLLSPEDPGTTPSSSDPPPAMHISKSSSTLESSNSSAPTVHQLQEAEKREEERIVLIRMALSRPFSRQWSSPSQQQPWVVEVLPGEWDESDQRWKYRIAVQRMGDDARFPSEQAHGGSRTGSSSGTSSNLISPTASFTSASTYRSLQDFCWLEQSLRSEYHGALLLPLLSMALHRSDDTAMLDDGDNDGEKMLLPQSRLWNPALFHSNSRVDHTSLATALLEEMMDNNSKVDCRFLSDWLSDVLNGVRGHGELLMRTSGRSSTFASSSVDVFASEAMETFLYRNTEAIPSPHRRGKKGRSTWKDALISSRDSCLAFEFSVPDDTCPQDDTPHHVGTVERVGKKSDSSALYSIFAHPLACFVLPSHASLIDCDKSSDGGEEIVAAVQYHARAHGSNSQIGEHVPLDMRKCSSRAAGDAVIERADVENSLATRELLKPDSNSPERTATGVRPSSHSSSSQVMNSEVLEAERDFVLWHRSNSLRAAANLWTLLEQEVQVGEAWKQLAMCLSNLFAFEKDVENAKVLEIEPVKLDKKLQPLRKLRKSAVDEGLRSLARQKYERSLPGLWNLQEMLLAYVEDLCAIDPALESYAQALDQLSRVRREAATSDEPVDLLELKAITDAEASSHSFSVTGWSDQLLSPLKLWSGMDTNTTRKSSLAGSHRSQRRKEARKNEESTVALQRRTFEGRVVANETLLKNSMTCLCRATPIRMARMAWKYFKREAGQAALLNSAAVSLRTKVQFEMTSALVDRDQSHEDADEEDEETELDLVRRLVDIAKKTRFRSSLMHQSGSTNSTGYNSEGSMSDGSGLGDTSDEEEAEGHMVMLREKAILLAAQRIGRWDSTVALAIMEACGVEDAEVRMDEITRELRLVRKFAIALRENVEKCMDALDLLTSVVKREDDDRTSPNTTKNNSTTSTIPPTLTASRKELLELLAVVFGGASQEERERTKQPSPSMKILANAGIKYSDSAGWLSAVTRLSDDNGKANSFDEVLDDARGNCGLVALAYENVRDMDIPLMLKQLKARLCEYEQRVEGIESYVYMHCVGIELEKHFSKERADALTAWEKKTDITTAINIATKKRLPLLVTELKSKLDALSPKGSHTFVKVAKERHLASKALKGELQALADRRFQRAREVATERVVAMVRLWAQHEESAATEELRALGNAIREIERTVEEADVEADGGAHLLFSSSASTTRSVGTGDGDLSLSDRDG